MPSWGSSGSYRYPRVTAQLVPAWSGTWNMASVPETWRQLNKGVQHQTTRMVTGLAKLSYKGKLKKMYLPSLAYWRARGNAIEVYTYLPGVYSVDSSDLVPLHESSSLTNRGHTSKLIKKSCRTQLRQNFFSSRKVNLWNNLPEKSGHAFICQLFQRTIWQRYGTDWQYKTVTNSSTREDQSTGILPTVPNADDDDNVNRYQCFSDDSARCWPCEHLNLSRSIKHHVANNNENNSRTKTTRVGTILALGYCPIFASTWLYWVEGNTFLGCGIHYQ